MPLLVLAARICPEVRARVGLRTVAQSSRDTGSNSQGVISPGTCCVPCGYPCVGQGPSVLRTKLASRVCPARCCISLRKFSLPSRPSCQGVEATLFATLMSLLNSGTFVGSALGSALTAWLGVTSGGCWRGALRDSQSSPCQASFSLQFCVGSVRLILL